MEREFNENDWRLFKERLPLWRERYMERLIQKYRLILDSAESAEERFFKLTKRIDKDSWNALFSVEMSRSKLNINIMRLLGDGVIEIEDLDGFSEYILENMSIVKKRRCR